MFPGKWRMEKAEPRVLLRADARSQVSHSQIHSEECGWVQLDRDGIGATFYPGWTLLALSTWPGMFLESQDRFLAEKRREMGRVPTGEQIDNVIQDIAQGFRINPEKHTFVRMSIVAHHVLRLDTGGASCKMWSEIEHIICGFHNEPFKVDGLRIPWLWAPHVDTDWKC